MKELLKTEGGMCMCLMRQLIGSDGRVRLSVERAHTSRRREGTGQETGQQADGWQEPASFTSTLLQLYSQLKKTRPDPAERLERDVRGLKRKQSKAKQTQISTEASRNDVKENKEALR